MPKRFTDTEKWRKGFIRSLEAPYKLLWLYILDECDHAGIWHVELDVACVRIGFQIDIADALKAFDGRVHPFDNGQKWFIPDFISFQYGDLNEVNRVHQSVGRQLRKYDLIKVVTSPLQGAKEKDKDKAKEKDKDKEKEKGTGIPTWEAYSSEYETQYGTSPTRNKKTNGICVQLVDRLGSTEAPLVAAFYVHHRNGLYVASGHCLDLLLRDAEKIRTEWATGRQMTQSQARQGDKRATEAAGWAELIAQSEKGE